MSEPLRTDVASFAKKATVVTIPNLEIGASKLNSEVEKVAVQEGAVRLLTVGSLTPLKAQHLLISALSFLDEKVSLSVVGAGPELTGLVELVAKLGLSSRVSFEGFLDPEAVRMRMRQADLLVHCAVAETFGLVYVEAAEEGLSVISTRNAVSESMIPKYVPGWLCDSDPSSLAEEISRRVTEVIPKTAKAQAKAERRASFGRAAVLSQWMNVLSLDNRTAESQHVPGQVLG